MHPFLDHVFGSLERSDVQYCLMRDADRLDDLSAGGELDLLVQRNQLTALEQALAECGCVRLPMRGYAPHVFFACFDPDSNHWFKLDVVTEVAFGYPVAELYTDLARGCLARRSLVGPTYTPSPEDEFVCLLLHVVLDKGQLAQHRQARLQALRQQVSDEAYATRLLQRYWLPDATWASAAETIDMGRWDGLLRQREAVAAHLAKQQGPAARWRKTRARALRLLDRARALVAPTVPSIALLGPDGAGKSTLSSGLENGFCLPVDQIYMGLYSQNAKRRKWPIPGIGSILLIVGSWRRYLKARSRQARGHLVIFDRYPYDALLPSPKKLSAPKRLRRWLLAHSCPPPNVVVILDAPGELLYARKGEHSAEILEQQRQAYLSLRDRLPNAAVVNAAAGAQEVQRQVNLLIWRALTKRDLQGSEEA